MNCLYSLCFFVFDFNFARLLARDSVRSLIQSYIESRVYNAENYYYSNMMHALMRKS